MDANEPIMKAILVCSTCGDICCQFCGRVYFADYDGGCWEGNELRMLLARQRKEPQKYVGPFSEDIHFTHINGKQLVLECPCADRELEIFQDFVWSHRYIIRDLLKVWAQRATDAAKDAEKLASGVEESIAAGEGA